MMSEPLLPLRIPGGWAVTYNTFFADVAMEIREGTIVNFEFFKEDLLMIEQLCRVDGRCEIDHQGWLLDVGWYPDSDPAGDYTLTLVRGGWDTIVLRVYNRDIQVIRAALERILDGLTRGEVIESIKTAVGGF